MHIWRSVFVFLVSLFTISGCRGQESDAVSDSTINGITHTSARFVWTTSRVTNGYIEYGLDRQVFSFQSQLKWNDRRHVLTLGGLRPNTQYYYRVVTKDEQNTLRRGPVQEFTTLPAPADRFAHPTPPEPVNLPEAPPEVTGQSWKVGIDEKGLCTDFQETIREAARDDSDRNHEIVIPAGARCVGNFELPQRAGTGWIVIRSSQLSELPEGRRVSPSESGKMAIISGIAPGRNDRHTNATLYAPYGEPTRRWYLAGLEVTHERNKTGVIPVSSAVAERDGIRVTTADPHGFSDNAVIQFYNLVPHLARAAGVVTVAGPREFFLRGNGLSSVPAAGAFVTADPAFYPYLWASKDLTSEVVFDRCYFHGQGFPDRLFIGLQLHGRRLQMVHSWLDKVSSWRSIPPGRPNDVVNANAYQISVGIDVSGTIGARIVNNHIETYGISLFGQEYGQPVWTQNIEVRGNRFTLDDRYRAHPKNNLSDGLYYAVRLLMEFKRGSRIQVDGNIFENLWVDAHSIPAAILLSSRNGNGNALSPHYIRDVSITNNVLRHNAAGIIVYGADDTPSGDTVPTSRVRIANNLIYQGDAVNHVTARGEGFISYRRGWCFGTVFAVEDIAIEHNNCIDPRGFGPMILWQGLGRGSGVRVKNNIFSLNSHSGLHGVFYEGDGTLSPVASGAGNSALESFRSYGYAAPGYDPESTFSYNVILPGLRDASQSQCFSKNSSDCTIDASACRQYFNNMPYIYCVDGSTAAGRLNAMSFAAPEAGNFSIGVGSAIRNSSLCNGGTCTDDGRDPGVNMDDLWNATRMIQQPVVEGFGDYARFRYRIPNAKACQIDLWDAASDAPISGQIDEGNEGDREHWLPARNDQRMAVKWRIACDKDIATGPLLAPDFASNGAANASGKQKGRKIAVRRK